MPKTSTKIPNDRLKKILGSESERRKLPARKAPYFVPKDRPGQQWQLGFEKLPHLEAWVIRWQRIDRSGYTVRRLGTPSPRGELSYKDAWLCAESMFQKEYGGAIAPARLKASRRAENLGTGVDVTISDCFDEYFEYLDSGESPKAKGSENALQHYKAGIASTPEKPHGISHLLLRDLTARSIIKWRRKLSESRAPSTVSRVVGTLRAAIRYFLKHHADDELKSVFSYDHIESALKTIRHETTVHAIASELIQPMLSIRPEPRRRAYEPDESFFRRQREWRINHDVFAVYLRLGLESGCRGKEIRKANVANWNSSERLLTLRYTKNTHDRVVAVNESLAVELDEITAGRLGEDPLLVRADGSRFTKEDQTKYMQRISQSLSENRGDEIRITFHMTRHTFSTQCANAGMPTIVLAKQLGHAELSLVERVYYSDNAKERVAMIDRFAPVFGSTKTSKISRIDRTAGV